jgi:hypothetical protein
MIIESKYLTSANSLEQGRSDESNDEVTKRGQPCMITRDLRHLLHPVGTCTDTGTLGSDTEREDLGDKSPGDRSPSVLIHELVWFFRESDL